MSIFKELNKQGNTIVLITHDDSVACQAQRSIRIMDGKVSDIEYDKEQKEAAEKNASENPSEDKSSETQEEVKMRGGAYA